MMLMRIRRTFRGTENLAKIEEDEQKDERILEEERGNEIMTRVKEVQERVHGVEKRRKEVEL